MELVRNHWDRDLLQVQYDTQQITIERLLETVAQEGFTAEVQEQGDNSDE